MKKFLIGLLVLVVLIVGGLSYLGVVPFISPLITKPKDLGIKADPALVTAFDAKYEMVNNLPDGIVPDDREPIYSGNKELDITITSEEITSIIDYWQKQYNRTPIREVQVRINEDGTGEVSGILETATAVMMAKQLNYSDEDIEKGKSYVKYVAGDLPFYLKGTASITNNKVSLNPSEITIGRVTLPSSLVSPVSGAVADVIERRIGQIGDSDIKEMSLQSAAVHFIGTVPNTIE